MGAVTLLLLSSRAGGAGLVELRAESAGAGRRRKRKRLRCRQCSRLQDENCYQKIISQYKPCAVVMQERCCTIAFIAAFPCCPPDFRLMEMIVEVGLVKASSTKSPPSIVGLISLPEPPLT